MARLFRYLSLVFVFFLGGCSSVSAAKTSSLPSVSPSEKLKGIGFASWWFDTYLTMASDRALADLRATGAEWVSVIVTWYQDDKTSTTIYADPRRTPSDAAVVHAINEAHRLGLRVMLKPHVDAQSGEWRGDFRPADLDKWFESYEEFITHFARMAAQHGVEMFCVGTELASINRDIPEARRYWPSLIKRVREVYSGPLTYAANWGDRTWGEFYHVPFWDLMDYVGIDAYFPLTEKTDPSMADLRLGWERWVRDIEAWLPTVGKPVLFTEIGYRSIEGTSRAPWDWEQKGQVNAGEQAACYKAAFEVFWDKQWFAGFFWWDWGTTERVDPATDTGYTPREKPAEEVLKRWYGR
jgi:hypothetical protein